MKETNINPGCFISINNSRVFLGELSTDLNTLTVNFSFHIETYVDLATGSGTL
jgi:hypothetical protein